MGYKLSFQINMQAITQNIHFQSSDIHFQSKKLLQYCACKSISLFTIYTRVLLHVKDAVEQSFESVLIKTVDTDVVITGKFTTK